MWKIDNIHGWRELIAWLDRTGLNWQAGAAHNRLHSSHTLSTTRQLFIESQQSNVKKIVIDAYKNCTLNPLVSPLNRRGRRCSPVNAYVRDNPFLKLASIWTEPKYNWLAECVFYMATAAEQSRVHQPSNHVLERTDVDSSADGVDSAPGSGAVCRANTGMLMLPRDRWPRLSVTDLYQ